MSNSLRTQLAKITHNFYGDDEEDVKQKEENKGFVESCIQLKNNKQSVTVHEDPSHRLHYGATIWKCCKFLCEYFDSLPIGSFQGRRAIELGSGTGLAGFSLALLGAKVTLTDTDMALPLIRHNALLNSNIADNINIMELDWYEAPNCISNFAPPFDIIIASDVVSCLLYCI